MNEEVFNMELRKFLKKFGITAQREIEKAVKDALDSHLLSGNETLTVKATLEIDGVMRDLVVDGRIALS